MLALPDSSEETDGSPDSLSHHGLCDGTLGAGKNLLLLFVAALLTIACPFSTFSTFAADSDQKSSGAKAEDLLLRDDFAGGSPSLKGRAGSATFGPGGDSLLRLEGGSLVLRSQGEYGSCLLAVNLAEKPFHDRMGFGIHADLRMEAEKESDALYLHLGRRLPPGASPSRNATSWNAVSLDDLSPVDPVPLTVVIRPGKGMAELRANRVVFAKGSFPAEQSGTIHADLKIHSSGMGLGVPAFAVLCINGREIVSGDFHWYLESAQTSTPPPASGQTALSSAVLGVTGKSILRMHDVSVSLLPEGERNLPPVAMGTLKPFWKYQPVLGPYLSRGQGIMTDTAWNVYQETDFPYVHGANGERAPESKDKNEEEVMFARGVNVVRLLGGCDGAKGDLDLAFRGPDGKITYRWENLRAKLDPYRKSGDYDYTFVLDNVPSCFRREPVSGPFGQVGGPDNLDEWHDFVAALCREITTIFGTEKANSFRFRLLTEARIYVNGKGGAAEHAPKAEYLKLYETTARAVKEVLPGAKFGPYNQSAAGIKNLFFTDSDPVRYPDVARDAAAKGLPIDFLCASRYYTAATDPDEFTFSFMNCFGNLRVEFPFLAETPLEIHEWGLNDFEAKRHADRLSSTEPGAFGTSLIAHMMVRFGEQGLDRLYHWGLLDPVRRKSELKGFLTGQGCLYLMMEPMIGGQAWSYRPADPLSSSGTKHLCLGSFKKDASYLLFTAHNTGMSCRDKASVRYLIPKSRFQHGITRVRYAVLDRESDPYTAIRQDLEHANLLKPDYLGEPLRISGIRDMIAGPRGEAFVADNLAKYEELRKKNLTLKPCPWKIADRGEDYEITVEMTPPEIAMVVID